MKRPKQTGFDADYADKDEVEIIEALNRNEFKEIGPRAKVLAEWQSAVRATARKKPITVRVQERDIASLKALALERGVPYQTLVASVLHQYVSGKLKEGA